MGIQLEILRVDTKRVFTAGDVVEGVVRLRLSRATVISDVTVSLEGSVRTFLLEKGPAFILGNDVPTVAEEHHKLFTSSKVLFPHANIPLTSKGFALPRGEFTFPFELTFPLSSSCSISQIGLKHVQTVLPPSFNGHATDHGAEAKIEYILNVEAKRSGRLRKSFAIQQNFIFSPPDPSLHLMPVPHSGWYARQAALYTRIPALDLTTAASASSDPLPVLLLEAKLPSLLVLYPGGSLPLHLCVRSLPMQMQLLPTARLRSLAITLQRRTSVTAGTHHTSWQSSTEIFNLSGLTRLVNRGLDVEELSDLNDIILHTTTVPNITPSFTTCTAEQTYALEVDAWFSVEKSNTLKPVKVVMNVEVWSGNGTGNELNPIAPANENTDALVPLRPGCLAHIGVDEGGAEERGPPPYR
ncbi:hypothetical protein BDV12DRAFT_202520 [Aspergillus spectabilis]